MSKDESSVIVLCKMKYRFIQASAVVKLSSSGSFSSRSGSFDKQSAAFVLQVSISALIAFIVSEPENNVTKVSREKLYVLWQIVKQVNINFQVITKFLHRFQCWLHFWDIKTRPNNGTFENTGPFDKTGLRTQPRSLGEASSQEQHFNQTFFKLQLRRSAADVYNHRVKKTCSILG